MHIFFSLDRPDGPVVTSLKTFEEVKGSVRVSSPSIFVFVFSSRERSYAHLLTTT